jgi:hypothetical protein
MARMGQQHSRVHVDMREYYVKLRKRQVVPKNNDKFQGFRHWPVYVYSCLLLYIELTRTSQTHAFSCIQKHCRKSMKSLPGHRSRTPHAQLELLLNILQTLLVSCLVRVWENLCHQIQRMYVAIVTGIVTAKKIHRLGEAIGLPGAGLNVKASFMLKND